MIDSSAIEPVSGFNQICVAGSQIVPKPHGQFPHVNSKRLLFCAHDVWMFNSMYRSGTLNSNTVNSKFHLIRSFFEIFARFLSFHV